MKRPPSAVLKEKFDHLTSYLASESFCSEIAKETLFSVSEVTTWFEHLHTLKENHRRGAAKAAETRRKKERTPSCYNHLPLCSMLSEVQRSHSIC